MTLRLRDLALLMLAIPTPANAQEASLTRAFQTYCIELDHHGLETALATTIDGVRRAPPDLLLQTVVQPTADSIQGWEISSFEGSRVDWLLVSFRLTESGHHLDNCGIVAPNIRPSTLLREIEARLPVERWYFAPLERGVQLAYEYAHDQTQMGVRIVVPDLQDQYSSVVLESIQRSVPP